MPTIRFYAKSSTPPESKARPREKKPLSAAPPVVVCSAGQARAALQHQADAEGPTPPIARLAAKSTPKR